MIYGDANSLSIPEISELRSSSDSFNSIGEQASSSGLDFRGWFAGDIADWIEEGIGQRRRG